MIENTDGANMIFKNEKLQTKYDMATVKQDTDEKYSIKDVCKKLCDVQYEIASLYEDGVKEIKLDDEYYSLKVDMKRIYEISGKQTADTMARKIRRNTRESKGLERKIFDIFGFKIKDIDKKREELQWSELEIKEFKKQYLKILYLFYVVENILFPSKKVIEIFRHPDMEFLNSENTDCGMFLYVIKNEIKKECEQSYTEDIENSLSLIKQNFSKYARGINAKCFDDRSVLIRLQSKCDEMDGLLRQRKETKVIYEKELLKWFYLQLCLYEERCYVNGYLRAYRHKIEERTIKDEYKLCDDIHQMTIGKGDMCSPARWRKILQFIAPYCFQKSSNEITDRDIEVLEKMESKLATYINIVNKQFDGIYGKRYFTVGECVAMIQEILCIDKEDDIKYDYFGHHNSDSLSLKRSLEKGHGNPLYIIQEMVLCRKFIRGRILTHKDYDENVFIMIDTMGKLESMILMDVFQENTNENIIIEKSKNYVEFLKKILE